VVQKDIENDEHRVAALMMIEEWIRQLEIDDENVNVTNDEISIKTENKKILGHAEN
jgi:hypothetical protein